MTMSTTKNPTQFALLLCILHWLMAILLVAMLFIGVSMVVKMGPYHWLLAVHRPLGILILILAAIRLGPCCRRGHFPIVMFGTFHLPPILPANPEVFAVLRQTHTILAYLFFTFLAHMGAVLFHTLVLRDGILSRMLPWSVHDPKGQV